MSSVHPRWGRPLDDYVGSYDLAAAKKRIDITSTMKAEAEESISQVVRLAGPSQYPDPEGTKVVTLQVLESILNLSMCPQTYHYFADPPLISGCLKLMGTVEADDRMSPFSYEYGYLCFKIIVLAIGTNILLRTENLDMTIANMESDTNTELILILSGHVSRAIKSEIEIGNAGQPCSWVLGWVRVQDRRRLQLTPLMLRSDILLLLDMLWDDRHFFLKTYMMTHSPGLSGVMFVLWRYLYSNSIFVESLPSENLAIPFCEILWRYFLVATTDQLESLVYINNDVQLSSKADQWTDSSKHVTLDDLRIVLQAYTGRMSLVDSPTYLSLEINAILVLLNFVTQIMQPRVEFLLPPLIGNTLDRIWEIINNKKEDDQETIIGIGRVFRLIGRLIRFLNHTYYASRYAVLDLVETLAGRDLPDMVARAMIVLEPYSTKASESYKQCMEFLENTTELFLQPEAVVPKSLLKKPFLPYAFHWIKTDQHFKMLGTSLSDAISPYAGYYQACRRVWHQVSQSLAMDLYVAQIRASGAGYEVKIRLSDKEETFYLQQWIIPKGGNIEDRHLDVKASASDPWYLRYLIPLSSYRLRFSFFEQYFKDETKYPGFQTTPLFQWPTGKMLTPEEFLATDLGKALQTNDIDVYRNKWIECFRQSIQLTNEH
ncbi:glycosyltransferase family protein [Rhizoctonia solani]|uniref:Glycosyltransferase family protein n=1 Tax=Rhizoctonia solani TaxID=456999 RepID=A0A8H8P7E0_9AGAM|nr:glycosyltransferase family protein [Rhizoctonia solani]QRW24902.1 glycosyltransferase family protein [Rhizoctonia solani]